MGEKEMKPFFKGTIKHTKLELIRMANEYRDECANWGAELMLKALQDDPKKLEYFSSKVRDVYEAEWDFVILTQEMMEGSNDNSR
jgi:hypothetical protein